MTRTIAVKHIEQITSNHLSILRTINKQVINESSKVTRQLVYNSVQHTSQFRNMPMKKWIAICQRKNERPQRRTWFDCRHKPTLKDSILNAIANRHLLSVCIAVWSIRALESFTDPVVSIPEPPECHEIKTPHNAPKREITSSYDKAIGSYLCNYNKTLNRLNQHPETLSAFMQ